MDSTKLFKLIYHFKTRRPKVGLKRTVYTPWYTSILHIINEIGNVVKVSEEDRRESLKSATVGNGSWRQFTPTTHQNLNYDIRGSWFTIK